MAGVDEIVAMRKKSKKGFLLFYIGKRGSACCYDGTPPLRLFC